MSIATRLTERAILLSKAGKKEEARQVLNEVLRQEPRNEVAWLWYVDTFLKREERIIALKRLLQVLPNHPLASKALTSLEEPVTEKVQVVSPKRQVSRFSNFLALFVLIVGICIIVVGGVSFTSFIGSRVQISSLKTENANLNSQLTDLSNRINTMTVQYQELERDYQELKKTAIVPPYISIANRNMIIGFIKTNQIKGQWKVGFDALESDLQRGNLARNSIQYDDSMWVELENTSTGEFYNVVDMTKFVDPSAFVNVIPDLYAEAGSDDAFIREVWYVVTQLATYSSDIAETPRYPLETFLAGGGDCEDTAILFASMILAAPVDWDVELVYLDIDNPNNPQKVNHVIVFIDTGSQEYLVETTEAEEMLPYTSGVTGWYFSVH
jgi:hypothetical protein